MTFIHFDSSTLALNALTAPTPGIEAGFAKVAEQDLRRNAERVADRRMKMDQRRLVAAVDHLFGAARFEADLHALAQREVLLHHGADGDVAVLLPIGVRPVAVGGLVDRHLDIAAAGVVAAGEGAPDLDMLDLPDHDGIGEELVDRDDVRAVVALALGHAAHALDRGSSHAHATVQARAVEGAAIADEVRRDGFPVQMRDVIALEEGVDGELPVDAGRNAI